MQFIFRAAVCASLFAIATAGYAETPEAQLQKAAQASQKGDINAAIEVLSGVITESPTTAIAWYLRGREHFRAGKVAESVADFEKYVELKPNAKSQQWELGISYYYAGKYDEGAKQFELYQTFHDQDVENSVWRYLCVARQQDVEKARSNMLPIENDPRVPMMQIYDLYRGKLEPDSVLKAAQAGNPTQENLNSRLFYAHLYIGLWHEAAGSAEEAKKHILTAEKHKITHYMWDVAHVHADRLRAAEKPKAENKP